jgi:KDO2-lipid IV(A) lauroyltransferase
MNWGRMFGNCDYGFILPALARFPVPLAHRLSDLRARIRFQLRRVSRERAVENLALAFPEKPPAELNRLALESFQVQARDEMESYWFDRPLPFLQSLVETEELEVLREACQRRRGVLLYTGHMGNPGIFLALVGRLGFEMNLIFRSLEDIPLNPQAWVRFGNKRVSKLERASGRTVRYAGRVSYFALRRLLRDHETLMMAIDVVPSLVGRTVTARFFGRSCVFPLGFTKLYLDARPSVVLWSSHHSENGKYRFLLKDITNELEKMTTPEEVTQCLVTRLEERLRLQPGIWLQWDALDQFFAERKEGLRDLRD